MNHPAPHPDRHNGSYLFDTEAFSAWGLLRLRQKLEEGLPLTPRPYLALAEQTGLTEQQVRDAVRHWQDQGLIKRSGLIVKQIGRASCRERVKGWEVDG